MRVTGTFLLLSLLIVNLVNPAYAYDSKPKGDWNEYKSTHFIIYSHPQITENYVKDFSKKCERYYDVITGRLGFNRFDFWLWEDRAKIFIYNSKEDYLGSAERPEWSGASVHVKKKYINTFYFAEDFFDVLLPHELSHIILREFIGLKARVPLWFDEGVAAANEKDSSTRYLLPAKRYVDKGVFIPIPQLDEVGYADIKFPIHYYPMAAALVIFFLEEYNKTKFVEFCRELRDGNAFYKAMDKVYKIASARALNEKFLEFMNKKSEEEIQKGGFAVEW